MLDRSRSRNNKNQSRRHDGVGGICFMLSILAVSIILPNPTDKFGDIHAKMSPTSNNFQEERARGVRDVPFLQVADGSGTRGQWALVFGATSAGEGMLRGTLTRIDPGLQRRLNMTLAQPLEPSAMFAQF